MYLSIRIYLLALLLDNGLAVPLPAIIGASSNQCSDYLSPRLDPVSEGFGTSRLVSYTTAEANPCPQRINPVPEFLLRTGFAGSVFLGGKLLFDNIRRPLQQSANEMESFATLADVQRLSVERAGSMAISHLRTVTPESAQGLQAAYLEALPAESLNSLPDSAVPGLQEGVRQSLERAIATEGSPINTKIINFIATEGVDNLKPWLLEIVRRVLPSVL